MTPEGLAVLLPVLAGAVAAALLLAVGWWFGRRSRPRALRRVEDALADLVEGRAPELDIVPGEPDERALHQVDALTNLLADRRGPRERRLGRFGQAVEALSGRGLLLLDRNLVAAAVGEPIARVVGEPPSELEGRKGELFFSPESWPGLAAALLDARRSGNGSTVRAVLRRAGGPGVPATVLFGAIDDPIEGIALWIEPELSALGRESPEEALERTRAILDAVSDGVIVVLNGRVAEANPRAERWFGAAIGDRLLRDLVDAGSVFIVLDAAARAEAGSAVEPVRVRLQPVAPSLRPREVIVEAAPADFGGRPAAVLTVRDAAPDLGARRRAAVHEARLTSVLDAVSEGVAWLAPVGKEARAWRVGFANRRLGQLLGAAAGSALGASEEEMQALLAHRFRDPAAFLTFLERAAASPAAEHAALLETREPDARSVEIGARPVFGEEGELLGRLLVVRDVTRHREAERRFEADAAAMARSREALQRAYEELSAVHRDLERKSAELDRLNRELTELDHARAQLLTDVSHELQTPLVSIRGYTQMVLDGRLGRVNDEQRRGLEVALRNVDRMVEMIGNLLTLARAERATPLEPEIVDLADELHDALECHQSAAIRRGVQLEARPALPGLTVLAEREGLARVLDNLLANAIKFNRAGGRVSVSIQPGPGDAATIEVADTGIGIPPEEQSRIFDRFYRGRGTAGMPGTGIGLAMVKSVVERHGGRIELESAPGKGSTFRVRWPRSAGASVA